MIGLFFIKYILNFSLTCTLSISVPVFVNGRGANPLFLFSLSLQFKLCVLALGTCFVLLLFALLLDAGEFAWLSRNMNYIRFLEKEGYECKTKPVVYFYRNQTYHYRECFCENKETISKSGVYVIVVFPEAKILYNKWLPHIFLNSGRVGRSLITSHNTRIIRKSQPQDISAENCNCRNKHACMPTAEQVHEQGHCIQSNN